MELDFTGSARRHMAHNAIEWVEVAAVIATPDSVEEGELLTRYDGSIGGRRFEIFVARGSDPMLVVTVVER